MTRLLAHGPAVSLVWTGILGALVAANAAPSLRLVVVLPFVLLVPRM
jgi:hypothetical protein